MLTQAMFEMNSVIKAIIVTISSRYAGSLIFHCDISSATTSANPDFTVPSATIYAPPNTNKTSHLNRGLAYFQSRIRNGVSSLESSVREVQRTGSNADRTQRGSCVAQGMKKRGNVIAKPMHPSSTNSETDTFHPRNVPMGDAVNHRRTRIPRLATTTISSYLHGPSASRAAWMASTSIGICRLGIHM